MVGLSCNKQCIQSFSGGKEFLCLSVGWLSQQGIFLSVACHFMLVSLPKVRCQSWGENVSFSSGTCCYLPQSDLCRLVGSILQLLWSSKPALGYEFPAAFASILSISCILSLWSGCAWGASQIPSVPCETWGRLERKSAKQRVKDSQPAVLCPLFL